MAPPVIWTYEPSVIVGVAAMSIAYVCGWLRARKPGQPHPPGYDRLALFALSMLCILVALVSPVDNWSTDFLFVHMIQHLLLLDFMPIALILSLTKGILRPVTRRVTVIERNVGPLGSPVFALLAYISMMIVWHIPSLYDTALHDPMLHVLEHACFATAGFLYWWHLLSPIKARQHLSGMGPVMYMVITKLTVGILGVVLAFSPHSFYPWYQDHIHYLNLSPTTDQNLAGLVMALEQSIVMGIAVGYFFVRALNESEQKVRREERFAVEGSPSRPYAAIPVAPLPAGAPLTAGPAGLPLARPVAPRPAPPRPAVADPAATDPAMEDPVVEDPGADDPAAPDPAAPRPDAAPLAEVVDQQALDRQMAR